MKTSLPAAGALAAALIASFTWLASPAPAHATPFTVSSPDGRLRAEVGETGGAIYYTVSLDGHPVLAPSAPGIRSDGRHYGADAALQQPAIREVDESYPFLGAKSTARNRARVATFPVTSHGETYALEVHVADDGVGVRLRLPAKPGRRVEADVSTWSLPGDPVVWATTHDPAYEHSYRTTRLSALDAAAYGLPLTARVDGRYVTLTEAALKDYGDLAFRRRSDGALAGFLPHDAQGWTTDAEVVQPWRVAIVARDLTTLVNSTLVQNLNPPADPALLSADWIRPGRSTWQWMAVGAPKFDDQRRWVDWTKELGYEYYLVDDGWKNWPDNWASLKSVCDHARGQGIKIWLWVHSNEVKDPEARRAYFQRAVEAGVVGVKIDFPPPTNREWATWYHDTARDAAAARLLVNFHGATKPTGMERTWPNELAREAVRGHEWHMTRYRRVLEPAHDTILPFTRYVIGHGDYTPVVLDPKELQGNTWAHELAQAVVFTAPFLCLGGHPRDHVANPAKDLISALPAVWDETRVLPGSEPGKIATFARRHGKRWFVAILNGVDATEIGIALDFLGPGSWRADLLGDAEARPDAWDRSSRDVKAGDILRLRLAARGGFVALIQQ